MTPEEIRARVEEIRERLRTIDAENAGRYIDPDSDVGQEWSSLNTELDEHERTLEQIETRQRRLDEIARNAEHDRGTETGDDRGGARGGRRGRAGDRVEDIFDLSTIRASLADPVAQGQELRDRALTMIERMSPADPEVDRDHARASAERLLNLDSIDGVQARYFLAVGSPIYKRAFGKVLQNAPLSREEGDAIQRAQMAERALNLSSSAGGFAVPFELDPTILNISDGVINPIREIARVEQISVDEWRGITSAGITASYAAEATETTDNAPSLAQPTVSTEKAQAFVPFSIEIGQDWTGMQAQLAAMLAEAKDVLEATKFISGSGTSEPFGLLTGIGAGQDVNAAAGQTFTLANLYSLKSALPPRYRPRARFLGDGQIFDRVRQFDTVGSSAAIWVDSLQDDTPGRLLGRPAHEASAMPDAPATGAEFLVYGDFSRYLIADRVGLSIELIPHLFGSNQRPTGQRGIYAYWRNGAKVIDANAFRSLLGVA